MSKTKAFALTMLLAAGPLEAADYVTPAVAIFGANALDLATTNAALARGGRELNPLMQNAGGRVALKAGLGVGVYALHVHLVKRGRKRAAWVATSTYVAANLAAAWSNSRQR